MVNRRLWGRFYLRLSDILYLSLIISVTSLVVLYSWPKQKHSATRRVVRSPIMKTAYYYANCPCSRQLPQETNLTSVCSKHATVRGPGQKVIATYFNLEVESDRAIELLPVAIPQAIKSISKQYPGWIIRLYTDQDPYRQGSALFCKLYCEFDNVDICHVNNLPEPYNDMTKIIGNKYGDVWPMLTFLDDTVSVFLDRNLNSAIYQREVVSVYDWLRSQWYAHSMKDHPKHYQHLVKNTLGFHLSKNRSLSHKIGSEILDVFKSTPMKLEALIIDVVYPMIKTEILEHASFYCNASIVGKSLPFGSERPDKRVFVGYHINLFGHGPDSDPYPIDQQCPVACRPEPDWEYC